VDYALLDLCLWVCRLYCPRESAEAVHTGYKDVFQSSVFQPVQYRKPEFGALVFSDPHSKHFSGSFHVYPYCYVYCLLYDLAFAADMEVDGIHEDYRIDALKRPALPFFH